MDFEQISLLSLKHKLERKQTRLEAQIQAFQGQAIGAQRSGIGKWDSLAGSTKCAVTSPCRGMSYPSNLNPPAWLGAFGNIYWLLAPSESPKEQLLIWCRWQKESLDGRSALIRCWFSPAELPQHLRQHDFLLLGGSNVSFCGLEILVYFEKREGCPCTNNLWISGSSRREINEAPKA